MIRSLQFMVAWRYLRSPRQEGFVSVLAGFSFVGIMLGVATLIIVMAVMNGFRHELLKKITSFNGHLTIQGVNQPLQDNPAKKQQLQALEGVDLVIPFVERQAIALNGGDARGILVRAMRPESFAKLPMLENRASEVSAKIAAGNGVVVGRRLAERLYLREGENISIMSPVGETTPFGTVPEQRTYKIVGLAETGLHQYDSSLVLMPLAMGQSLFKLADQLSSIDIYLHSGQSERDMAEQVSKIAGPHARVLSWRNTNQSMVNALEVERNVMFLILTLIILIAAFNIVSGLVMLVKDKTKDIAILRAMGATKRQIFAIFGINGMIIGMVGTALGVVLGLSFALNIETIRQWLQKLLGAELFSSEIYYLTKLPAKVDWWEVHNIVFMALILAYLATIYPAWRASNQDPAELLRGGAA